MRVAAIIAEYNPFHSGHRYHIEKTREAGATHIVAVMSGSVVQRGDVAVMSPHDRAEEAVKGGADLVLELPPQYSLGAARNFARAGVSVIRRLGCADVISFGAECGDVGELSSALMDLKDNELKIKSLMSRGRTYPQAAAEVCEPSTAGIIASPNNTLALEYLRALGGCEPPVPLAVKRTVPHDSAERSGGFASASEIRRMFRAGEDAGVFLGYDAGKALNRVHPAVADIVALDEVHAPVGIHLNDRIIVGLPCLAVSDAVHIRIPTADRGRIRDVACVYVRSENLQMPVRRKPRDAAHDMDAEFESQAVDVGRERPEAPASRGARESDVRRLKA